MTSVSHMERCHQHTWSGRKRVTEASNGGYEPAMWGGAPGKSSSLLTASRHAAAQRLEYSRAPKKPMRTPRSSKSGVDEVASGYQR